MYSGLRIGEPCPKCGREMERRCHRENESTYFKKPYYYAQWNYCKRCKHVQHYEKFKRFPVATENIPPDSQLYRRDDKWVS
jgi:hypothetical protein